MSEKATTISRRQTLCVSLLALAVAGLDQLSKALVRAHLALGSEQTIAGPFKLEHVENKGIALGALPIPYLPLALTVIGTALALTYWRSFRPGPTGAVAVALFLGGALGNGFDRALKGQVSDWLTMPGTAIFNLADVAVTVGAALILLNVIAGLWRGRTAAPAGRELPQNP